VAETVTKTVARNEELKNEELENEELKE